MKLWPNKTYIILSPLRAQEFVSQLLQHTEARASGYYWFRRDGISFTGEIDHNSFSIIKTVPYWNLSPVKIEGKFLIDEDPLLIKIKMFNSFTNPVLILILFVSAGLFYNYIENPPWLLFAGLYLVFYLILNIPFQIEAAKAKKILLDISDGRIIENEN